MNKRAPALNRRRFLHTSVAFAGAAPFLGTTAFAAWPDRAVKIVVPFAPGGPVDVIARLLQPLLAEELKANFFIENKPGAAGSIGVGQVARAEPDGYTVLITSNTIMINPLLYKSVPYDLEKDFIPLVD
ncbi:MAG TPA: tripartite tricarboxylate transporter substrate-binding protein, partial [Pseudolabrys sp.]|nr:tripartite tricarboxylate transporter substrate-binding protein [Pseudolabrys sp.]